MGEVTYVLEALMTAAAISPLIDVRIGISHRVRGDPDKTVFEQRRAEQRHASARIIYLSFEENKKDKYKKLESVRDLCFCV